ncbi:MAG TPA: alpha-2-macroglobulin family protein, partial [Prolixibacteraceae bacterium]|nr:alpha-2-macroglobulin family protein [Prolixibacteraceae bacterium]
RAEWLHGAVASSLKAVVEAEIFPEKTTFKGYEKYHFDHPGVTWSPTKQVLFDGRLDANGISAVPLGFPASASYPGKMKAFFTTRVFEEGGDFSINVQQAAFSPYKKYLGIRMPDEEDGWYSTGKNYLPEVIALTPEGTPASLGKVEVSLFKIDWRWWWESGDDYLARYVSGNNYQPLKRWSLQSSAMSEKLNLTVDYHNWNDNGRYLLYARDLESGQACGVTFYMSEWGGWRADALPDGATILAITTEKEKYATSEKMKVKIPSAPGSRALVSLEDGSSVKDIFWVNCSSNETAFEVDIKEGMAPTLYIYVTLIQPYGSAQNDAPIRLYGVHHVTVEDPATLLHPEIRMNEELEPEKEFTVNIKEQHGNPMTYTIAVVDEGLLDLTGFKTPDPHAGFYAREALGVLTWDMFDYVAGAYGARLEKAFAVGGDEERLMAGRKQANRFQPVVLYAGPFTLGKGASRTHQFKMPAYVGSVKAMVVAGSSGAWGNAEKTAKVRKSVMLLTTAPRMAGPGEEFSLPVEVFAMKENTRNVTVSISGNELVIPEGNTTQTLSFDQPGSKIVRFKVRTSPRTGIGRIRINAQSGSESSVQETELEIRNPNPPVVDEKDKLLNSRESWTTEMDLPGMSGSNSAVLELSTVPGLNLSGRLQELIAYPHGCAEQTVSVALGQLYLGNLTALSDETKVQTETNIKAAIQQLRGMQTSTGGFSIWPGQNNADDWCSSYAGHFLLLAAQKGYAIPEDMKKRWTAFQVSRARVWKPAVNAEPFIRHQENLVQAYRLYTLALAGAPETGVMNRFREEITGSPDARWRLAAAYLLMGQSAAANQLITLMPEGLTAYEPEGITYGSPLRDKAMILETLVLKNDRKAAFKVVAEMASEIGSSPWLSTQTAAWSFYAIARYFGNGTTGQGIQATVTLNGKKENVTSGNAVLRLPVSLNGNSSVKAAVTNEGQGTLYARLVSRGIPLEDKTPEVQRNLRVETLFTDRNGQPLNPASLPQGSDLFIQVTVSHPGIKGKYRNLA